MFEPPYLLATEEVGPRNEIWPGTECLLPCSAITPVYGLGHLCTYPDVFSVHTFVSFQIGKYARTLCSMRVPL